MRSIIFILFTFSALSFSVENGCQSKEDLFIYKKGLKYITSSKEFSKGFLFLTRNNMKRNCLPNKFRIKNTPAIKVSKYVYENSLEHQMGCSINKDIDLINSVHVNQKLTSLSNTSRDDRFLLYFSDFKNNYLECKIVAKKESEDDFIPNTNFGRVVIIKLCFNKEGVVQSSDMTLIRAN